MFRAVAFDFTCKFCGRLNEQSKVVAGETRTGAEENTVTKSELKCDYCGTPVAEETEVHFSQNDDLSGLRNRS